MPNSCCRTFLLVSLAALLAACGSEPTKSVKTAPAQPELPKPAVSEYVRTEAAGFAIDDGAEIRYTMAYLLQKEIGEAPSFMVEFENPADGEMSLANGGMLEPYDTEIVIDSPPLSCIDNHRNYAVRLKLFSGGSLVANHQDLVQFSVPASLMEEISVKPCRG